MQAVTNAALPIFALILVGYLSGYFGQLDRIATDRINLFVVNLALPAVIFLSMSKMSPADLRQFGFAGAFAGGIAVAYGLGFLQARLRGRGAADASIHGLGAGYSNVGFMGIPLSLLLFGSAGAAPAIVATLFTASVLFLFAIACVEFSLPKGDGRSSSLKRVAFSLLRNPLLLSPIAGALVAAIGVSLPAPFEKFVSLLAGAASPCALVCIGLFLAQERTTIAGAGSVFTLVVLKLFVQPAVTAVLAYWVFDVPPLWARAAVLLAALPIGSGAFTIANVYGLETRMTSGAILASHVVSVVTVSILVAWLG